MTEKKDENTFANDVDILKARIISLRSGNHNLQTAQLIVAKIYEAINSSQVTLEQLGTSKEELDKIIQQKQFYNPEVVKFLELWKAHNQGKDVLDQLLPEFLKIKKALTEKRICPADLQPAFPASEYFYLENLLESKNKK